MTEYIITIKDRLRARRRRLKTLALPSKQSESLSRRRPGPAITFYDCASVKDGLTYRDHPILKVPGYSVSNATADLGAEYEITDGWGTSDYSDFHDLLFEIPIDEWKDNYRKLEFELNPSPGFIAAPTTYPTNLLVRYSPQSGLIHRINVFTDDAADISTPTGKTQRTFYFGLYKTCWDSRGLEYRSFTELNLKGDTSQGLDWFSMSTVLKDLFEYKITATNDSSAADVGDLTITGNIDVYLIPHIGLFMGASSTGPEVLDGDAYDGHDGMQILGPWYQVNPRHLWPGYVDPYLLTDQDLLKADYLDYQKNRTDAQASYWQTNGVGVVIPSALSPIDFAVGNLTWKTIIANAGEDFYALGTAGTYTTGNPFFSSSDPILMAVIKLRGSFYYVWSGDTDVVGTNTATGESNLVNAYECILKPDTDQSP